MFTIYLISLIFLVITSADSFSKPIDLSWSFENSTIYWIGVRPFEFTKMIANYTEQHIWYAMNEFCAGEHGGTHIDAPYHFDKHGKKVGDIPLDKLITEGALIDISEEVHRTNSSTNLEPRHLIDWVHRYGEFDKNTVILIKFGYSKYYPDRKLYLGPNEPDSLYFPGVSKEAAKWIVKNKRIVGVGVDVASVDPGQVATDDAHVELLTNDIYVIENAKLLTKHLPPRDFRLLVLPMNIQEGTGAPLRLVAEPKRNCNPKRYH